MSDQPPKQPPTARERTWTFLLYGFAGSILLHVLIGPLVKFKHQADAPEKTQTVSIERIPTPPPTPKPTPKPTPTPPPTPPPKQTPPPKRPPPPPQAIKINTIKTKGSTTGTEAGNTHTQGSTSGNPVGVPSGAPSAAPAVTPAPTAPPAPPTPVPLACAIPNADPKTISAAEAETPALAQQQGITGEVSVRVTLDANSNLVSAVIDQSPSPLLNNAALQAARQSKFQTKIVACKPVGDTYRFIVDFQSQ